MMSCLMLNLHETANQGIPFTASHDPGEMKRGSLVDTVSACQNLCIEHNQRGTTKGSCTNPNEDRRPPSLETWILLCGRLFDWRGCRP
jgi:hypothetical protein